MTRRPLGAGVAVVPTMAASPAARALVLVYIGDARRLKARGRGGETMSVASESRVPAAKAGPALAIHIHPSSINPLRLGKA
jgi:hypothetical protein